jgi:hypothetical protein
MVCRRRSVLGVIAQLGTVSGELDVRRYILEVESLFVFTIEL